MHIGQKDFLASLDGRAADIVDSCTACGKCVEVCPMPGLTGIDASDPEKIVLGVLGILRDGKGPESSARWASVCTGSGHCISACDYGVNPRFMLALARRALKKAQPEEPRREAGKKSFKDMSRGVRVLSRLQLPPALLERLNPSSHPERSEPPDLVFYTGCNMLKTPHIGLLCLDVLDRLGISYEVYGGPANCCGVLQWRPGDDANAGRQGYKTIERFAQTKKEDVQHDGTRALRRPAARRSASQAFREFPAQAQFPRRHGTVSRPDRDQGSGGVGCNARGRALSALAGAQRGRLHERHPDALGDACA
jgi:Fe-S oxidoreductase